MDEQTVLATYRVRADGEEAFQRLLASHWPTLRRLGLVTERPPSIFRSAEDPPTYVEIFTWASGGVERAHDHPDVLAIWEPMDLLVEEREGRPGWEFPHFLPWAVPHS